MRKILSHTSIMLCGMMIVFYLIDRVNPAMSFINNDITKTLLFIMSIIGIFNAIIILSIERAKERNRIRRSRMSSRSNDRLH